MKYLYPQPLKAKRVNKRSHLAAGVLTPALFEYRKGDDQPPLETPFNGSTLKSARSIINLLFALGVAALALVGCASAKAPVGQLYSPPPSLSGTATPVVARSQSAMEAISRGVAAVTPPGAALQDVYFQFDSIDLITEAQEILKKNAEWMKANPKSRVEVEGHCDDVGSAEYNLALGAKRAQVAKDFLISQGIAPDRLVTISYGKEAPACFEETEECRVQNRRARFVMFTELPTS